MTQVLQNESIAKAPAGKVPTILWLIAAAFVLLLLVSAVNSKGLDRLVPKGEIFLPYFVT